MVKNGGLVSAEMLGKWALTQFALELSYKKDGEWVTVPFSWAAVQDMSLAEARGGWLVDAASHIYEAVWAKAVQETDELKKA